MRTTHDRQLGKASALLLGLLLAVSAQAQETPEEAEAMADALFESPFKIDDANPEANIPSEKQRNDAPIEFGFYLMNLSERAEGAEQRNDFATAAKFYRAIALAVPERAVGFVKLCRTLAAAGDRAKAEEACGAALLREGVTVDDYVRYAHLVVEQPQTLSERQIKHVDDVVAHLKEQGVDRAVAAEVQCQLGLRLKDRHRLEQCTSELQQLRPNEFKTIWYQWILAIMRFDRATATGLVARAKAADAAPEVLRGMEDATERLRSPWEQKLYEARPTLLWLAGAACLGMILAWTTRRLGTLRKPSTNIR